MDTRLEIKHVFAKELHTDALAPSVQRAFARCSKKFSFLKTSPWYLAGGTALALQVGHRISVDLDFFISQKDFDEDGLERFLLGTKTWKTTLREQGTLYGEFIGVKMSFIAYPFFCPGNVRVCHGVLCMLLPEDIASMKIVAISQRGRKRDFVDLYWYCLHRESLMNVVRRAVQQYPSQEDNMPHILKSLVYFDDAQSDPMPKLLFAADWKTVKKFFIREVPLAAQELLQLT